MPFFLLIVPIALLGFVGCRSTDKIVLDEEQEEVIVDGDEDGFWGEEDCDDGNSLINPNAIEECDGFDNDCDGEIDEDVTQIFFADNDGDGFGDSANQTEACEIPDNYVLIGNDCNDDDPESYPAAAERCDGEDNDCDGDIDEDLQGEWYEDQDGDGFGNPDLLIDDCDPPAGYVADDSDCDDGDELVNRDAAEICDGIDNDCDQLIDDADADVDYSTAIDYYIDNDDDGYGAELLEEDACTPPEGAVPDGDDCDDANELVHPGAIEDCDFIDNDCDGLIDTDDPDVEGTIIWYLDDDRDGFGDNSTTIESCEAVEGYASVGDDCDDDNDEINPGARESCDNEDENCNGLIDDGALGSDSSCPGVSCNEILLDGSDDGNGIYWLDPDGDGLAPQQAWCDMITDGGGWTRLFGSLYPTFWASISWQSFGQPEYDDYSMLDQRTYFADLTGAYTFRLQMSESGNWDTTPPDHQTIWEQSHDPFSATSDGSDYVLISGDESISCGGFAGLHSQHHDDGGLYAIATDQDNTDNSTCWWLQVIPLQQFGSSSVYPGYVDSFDVSGGYHQWQQLWVK